MSIKTVASYTCAIFSVIVLILCLCTNYWIEYETVVKNVGKTTRTRIRSGLWEYCSNTKLHEDKEFGATKCHSIKTLGEGLAVTDWTGKRNAVAAMLILALLVTLVAFVFVTVYCITDKYYFPVTRSAILFLIAGILVVIGLSIYTDIFINMKVQFSWSYGAGWSAAAMYIISVILLLADK